MAIHDAGPYKLVMRESSGARQLSDEGWKVIAQGTTKSDEHNDPVWYWLMAPPEPQEPTLAERLRSEIAYGINAELADDAAVALEHYDRLKEAVRVLSLTEPEASGKMPIRVDSDAFGLLLAILRESQ